MWKIKGLECIMKTLDEIFLKKREQKFGNLTVLSIFVVLD